MMHLSRKDIALLLIAVFVIALFFLIRHFAMGEGGDTVSIEYDGSEIGSYSLWQDETISFDDNGHNLIRIKDGSVWIEEADCPDGLCISQGKISRNGQMIVCLPHRLILTIHSDRALGSDTVAG